MKSSQYAKSVVQNYFSVCVCFMQKFSCVSLLLHQMRLKMSPLSFQTFAYLYFKHLKSFLVVQKFKMFLTLPATQFLQRDESGNF